MKTLIRLTPTIVIFHLKMLLTCKATADENPDYGHIQELSRATMEPSSEIFIFSGAYFYLYDIESEELKDIYEMTHYYKGVPTDMHGVALFDQPDEKRAIQFVKGLTSYGYFYTKDAFKNSSDVIENMDKREDLMVNKLTFSYKQPKHEGSAYNRKGQRENTMSVCANKRLSHCFGALGTENPVRDCTVNAEFGENARNCQGLAISQLNDTLYLVLADNGDLVLFSMDANGKAQPEPFKRISADKIFPRSNMVLTIVVSVLVVCVVIFIALNGAVFVIWYMRRRRQGRTTLKSQETSVDSVTVPKVKSQE